MIVSILCQERDFIDYPEVPESDNCFLIECLSEKNFLTDTFKFVCKFNRKVKEAAI